MAVNRLEAVSSAIELCWTAETSYWPEFWRPGTNRKWGLNRYRGQCAVSALVVQDFFGGDIRHSVARVQSPTWVGKHTAAFYWNELPPEEPGLPPQVVDLTSKQYPENGFSLAPGDIIPRGRLLGRADVAARYEILRESVVGQLAIDCLRDRGQLLAE